MYLSTLQSTLAPHFAYRGPCNGTSQLRTESPDIGLAVRLQTPSKGPHMICSQFFAQFGFRGSWDLALWPPFIRDSEMRSHVVLGGGFTIITTVRPAGGYRTGALNSYFCKSTIAGCMERSPSYNYPCSTTKSPSGGFILALVYAMYETSLHKCSKGGSSHHRFLDVALLACRPI